MHVNYAKKIKKGEKNNENINELDSQLVSALSDMSKPLNKIDIKDKVLEDVHVIDENKEDEN